jgi:hypothetical protein
MSKDQLLFTVIPNYFKINVGIDPKHAKLIFLILLIPMHSDFCRIKIPLKMNQNVLTILKTENQRS